MPDGFLVWFESVIGRPFTAVDGKCRSGVSAPGRCAYYALICRIRQAPANSGVPIQMANMFISGAEEIDISAFAPPTAISITLRIKIEPPNSIVLVYSPRSPDPVQFRAPSQTQDVPIEGPKIYIQKAQGARQYQIECLGFEDDIG